METKDPNHFDPNYFAPGENWDAPDLAQSEISYQAARAAFEAAGRKIIDATVNGACTVFEKTIIVRFFYRESIRHAAWFTELFCEADTLLGEAPHGVSGGNLFSFWIF